MFGIGFSEIIIILLVALVVLGPEELPKAARKVAKFMAELRHTEAELKHDLLDIAEQDSQSSAPIEHSHGEH